MSTKNTLIRNRYSLKQMLSLSLSIALTLVVIDQVPGHVSAKLQSAIAALNASDTATTCDALKSFINQSEAQSGKALTEEQARQLINAASQIRTTLGCQ